MPLVSCWHLPQMSRGFGFLVVWWAQLTVMKPWGPKSWSNSPGHWPLLEPYTMAIGLRDVSTFPTQEGRQRKRSLVSMETFPSPKGSNAWPISPGPKRARNDHELILGSWSRVNLLPYPILLILLEEVLTGVWGKCPQNFPQGDHRQCCRRQSERKTMPTEK